MEDLFVFSEGMKVGKSVVLISLLSVREIL